MITRAVLIDGIRYAKGGRGEKRKGKVAGEDCIPSRCDVPSTDFGKDKAERREEIRALSICVQCIALVCSSSRGGMNDDRNGRRKPSARTSVRVGTQYSGGMGSKWASE